MVKSCIGCSIKNTKILMISGMAQDYNREKAFEVGADSYIKKPFDTTFLITEVERLLADLPPPKGVQL